MALSYQNYTGDNVTDTFSIPFTYTDTSEISVTVDGVAQTGLTFPSASSVQLTSPPATSTLVQVRRNTDLTARSVDYVSGSVLTEEDLDNANIQVFHAAQEAVDKANDGIVLDADDKWDAQSKVIKNVADPVANTDAVNKQFISTNLPNINTVAGIAANVTTVAGISSDVTAVAADATDIGTVSSNIASVNTVASNIADVVTVANDLNEAISEIETAADDLNEAVSDIDTVSTNIANVNAVGGDIANVNTVAGSISNVNTVAGNDANVTTVAGISGDVTTVASNNANVTAVAGNATNINTVAANNANVTTVAGISANVTAVAADATDIGTVASNIANVNTVAANNSNITAVAADAADIGTVASNIANVNAVGGDITNVNTVAANLTDVNAFADTYFISATAPASPTTGDLWFDTSASIMKVYDGSGFVNAGSSVNGTSERQTYTATGGQTTFAATYDAGYVDVYLNGVKLINGSDFTATNGTSIVLSTGATAGDTVDIVAYGTFDIVSGIALPDNAKAIFGAGSDLQIYHDGTHSYIDDASAGGWLFVRASELRLQDQGGTNTYLLANSGGAVSIRHANSEKLTTTSGGIDVTGTVTADGLTVDDAVASADLVYLNNTSATASDVLRLNTAGVGTGTNILDVQSGSTTHFLVRGDGNVGIGTALPDELLELSSGSPKIKLTDTNNTSGQTGLVANISAEDSAGTQTWLVGREFGSTGLKILNKENSSTIFETNGTERMRILDGGGITFNGDTAAANALDDYEEGTWTPTSQTNAGTAATFGSAVGQYTKIGNVVYFNLDITNIDTTGTTSTGQLQIGGLPFTVDVDNTRASALWDSITFQGSRTTCTATISTSEYIALYATGTGIADTVVDNGDITSGVSDVFISGFYYTNQ